jgi:hypothetical protein
MIMKALRIIILAIVTMMASGAMAQTVYNSSGSSCGKIESDGTIRNSSGSSVGRFDSDGTIRNSSGSSIGKIDGDQNLRLNTEPWFTLNGARLNSQPTQKGIYIQRSNKMLVK